jgi:hypothetical protein
LLHAPEIVEVIARETNRYAQNFLENRPNLKLRSMTHHSNKTNRNEIMKLLAFFLLQELHQKLDNKRYFSQRNILETPIFLTCSMKDGFTFYPSFCTLLTNESYDEATCSSKYCITQIHTGSTTCQI